MNNSGYSIPVLFIVFKRPQVAMEAFKRIKKVKPQKLYLACDGPRNDKEKVLVEETKRVILESIDWDCEVNKKFEEQNLGCAYGVLSAINWMFENETEGIILEDDCVVQDSFFRFMREMLDKYRDDNRIGMIDGANYINNVDIIDSYCFSKFKSTNGWATWRRAWKNMDMDMKWRNTPFEKSVLVNTGFMGKDYKYWKYKLKVIDNKQASAWDWQWYFSLSANNQLSVFPKYSLVTNIGFGEGATHTTEKNTPSCYIAKNELEFPLSHPKYIIPYYDFDKNFYKSNNTLFYTLMRYIPFGIKNYVKKIVRR